MTTVEEKNDIEELRRGLDFFEYNSPLCRADIHNTLVKAHRRVGCEGIFDYLRAEEVDERIGLLLDPDKTLEGKIDSIRRFISRVKAAKEYLDRDVVSQMCAVTKPDDGLYSSVTRFEGEPAIYSYNPYDLTLQKLDTIRHDLKRAHASRKDPAWKVIEMCRVLDWHEHQDPNFEFVSFLSRYLPI